MHLPVPSRRALIVTAWVIGIIVVVLLVYLLAVVGRLSKEDREGDADREELRSAITEANKRLRVAGEEPVEVPPEATTDDPENQDPEVDDPDPDDPERQERERQEAEQQDPEVQNPERNDGDPNDPEVDDPDPNDGEVDDPDPDDPENQDPEVDDPDPNSALNFAADDSCTDAPAGSFITGVDINVVRSEGTVTYVLTCTSASILGFLPDDPPANP